MIFQSTGIDTSSGVQPRSQGINVFTGSGPGVQITDNIMADPTGATANETGIDIDSATSGITADNNIIYGFASPVVNGGSGDTTSPNAINLSGYVNPNVSVETYNASLGGSATLAAFMAAVDSQSMTNWNSAYTAAAVDAYIQAGFATMVTQVTASPGTGAEVAGKTITMTMDFGQAVTVTGTPTLSLNDGGTATYTGGSGTTALTFSYTVGSSDTAVSSLAITAVNLPNGATVDDEGGNPTNFANALVTFSGLQIATSSGPTLISIAELPSSGDLNTGKTVTLTLGMNEAVTVNTTGGTPTLTLNDGSTATYKSGSGTSALVFSYTVAAGQNTAALAATAINLNGATVTDGSGNAANLSLSGLAQTGPQIDTTTPTITAIAETPSSGDLDAGKTVTYTLTTSEAVTVSTTGGSPTLSLNDGGTATYVSGSGSNALTFSYTVLAGQNTSDLTVTAVNLNGATIADGAGNAANVSLTGLTQGSPEVDTTPPTISSVTATAGDYKAGKALTLTLAMSEAVTVSGTPTLTLNDGGTASYVSGSGSSSLVFSYTVGAGQNTSALQVTGVTGTITDLAGNALSTAGLPETFTGVVVDTTTPSVSSVTTSGTGITSGSGDLGVGKVVTLTVAMSEAVTVSTTGGTPTLTLNDGGTATYSGGSGTSALTFTYTVAAGQSTSDLTVTAYNANGGTITNGAGAAATMTGAVTNPAGTLQIDTTTPSVSSVTTSGTGITSGSGDLGVGKVVTLTVAMSEAVTVSTTGGTPTLTLNDGGTATYSGGSGTSALTFTYTVAAGQSTSDLTVTAYNANGGTIANGAGAAATMTGAVTNPAGTLQIDTTTPSVSSVTTSGTGITSGSGDLGAGSVVMLTVNMSEAVAVAGGTPSLTLSDGGTATYSSGSGSSALVFSYTVAAGQNASDLSVTAFNANGATIANGAGTAATMTGAVTNPAGTLQIDTATPAISSLLESPTTGDLNAGKTVTLTLDMSEMVTVNTSGGTPTLTLNDGGIATYASGSGTNALTFSYTVGAGQNTAGLAATAVNLNGATVADGAGNTANLSLTGLTQSGPQIDTTTPTVSSVVATGSGITSGNGDLGASQVVTLTVNMSEAVSVNTSGGTPSLTLNDGGTATYSSGSGTSALVFTYTVAAGQNTSDLAITAFNANGGSINNGASTAANMIGAVTNPSGTLQIDTTTPTISSLVESPSSGDLDAGNTVTLTLAMSEAVTVNTSGGTPTLTLNDGTTAIYTSGSGTNALTFTYAVAAGQNTAALAATAVNLNGGTIADGAGNAANLSLTGLAQTGPQIDTTRPTIVSIAESPSSGDLNAGKTVTLTVVMSEVVTVSTVGTNPTLMLNTGTTATYGGGSGTNELQFTYTVAPGALSISSLAATAVNLNGATIADGAGNTADLSLTGLTQTGPEIDTTTPTISAIADLPSSADLNSGKTVTLTLDMSEVMTVNTSGGTPTLTLNDGGKATYSSGSGTSTLVFSYTVATGQDTASLAATAVNLNGATIADGAGNAANLSLVGLTQSGPQIDTTTPTVSSVTTSGTGITGGSGDLDAGKVVTLTVAMSEAVTVNTTGGTPSLTLNDGGTATYSGGSGSSALTFSYTVAAGQNTSDLTVTAFNANGATIVNSAGTAATMAGAVTNPAGTLLIDTTAPVINSISESPSNGDLDAGKTVTLTLGMSEVVSVNTTGGTPTLTLDDGTTATYASGSGTNALTFTYTVAAGQNTAALAATAVNLNGATIADGAGNAANLSLAGLTQSGPQIDTTTPTISAIADSPASGALDAGKTVTLTLAMSEAVTVNTSGGAPTLTLNDGGTATYSSGSGTNALTFTYTVAAGQNTAALAATAVNLNGATIADGAGNVANLSLTGLTQSGPQINTTSPAIDSIVESPSSGDLNAGKTVTLTLGMSEVVTVNTTGGTPTLTLDDGTTATYASGSGTNALTFTYTVAAGQNTAALAATAVNLNGATIADGAGNAANLSLAGLTQSGPQIDTTTPTISAIADLPASGALDAGKTVTLTLAMSEAVTVNTSGGAPTLTLNDGGTATYSSGSGTNALTFTYTVAAGQNTAALAATAVNLNGATIADGAGNVANLSLTGLTQSGPQINTTSPAINSIVESPSSGDLNVGKTVTLTLGMSEVVSVNTTGGTPTLTLDDGTTATYASGSGTNALTFTYTVAAGQNTAALAATAVNLNGATIVDGSGNAANLSLSDLTQSGPQIDTTTPTVSSVTTSGTGITAGSGDLTTGAVVTLTLNLNEAATVSGGAPTLTLNDGGTATYSSGSGTNALTFSYTVAAGQNTSDLTVTAFNANGATIANGAGTAAIMTGAVTNPAGTLQIDTTTPVIASVSENPASGHFKVGKTITLTLAMSEVVTVNTAGGTPTLTLNDGGIATYASGSGSNALTFSYTVTAGQNATALAATAVNLNGGTIQDGAGNAANLSLGGLIQAGAQIDTLTPTITRLRNRLRTAISMPAIPSR